jgi:Trk K+ transport system NAD-binding subunit
VPARIRRISRRRHFIVCGDNPLAHRLVTELLRQSGGEVTVILPSKRRNHGPQIARMDNVRIVEAELTKDALQDARIDTALALALVNQDDVGNVHAAMWAQELNSDLRIVVRMFDTQLGRQLRAMFTDCAILSDAAVAAPWFVADALGELAPIHVHMQGRTMRITERSAVTREHIVCGLAETSPDRPPRLLPGDPESANLVLTVADGTPQDPLSDYRRTGRLRWARVRQILAGMNRTLLILLISFLVLLILVTIAFAVNAHHSWGNSVYLTILDAAGAAQPEPADSSLEKFAQAVVTVIGIALIPVITAAAVDLVFGGRLAAALGRLRRPVSNHFVVVGLGNVGSRVVEQLHDLGLPIVCVERNPDARGVRAATRLGVPVIFGDVNEAATLREASVGTCRALLALTSDDITNLRAGLTAQEQQPDMRIVLRLFDGDFAQRVEENYSISRTRSVSALSAPSFAMAMAESQVIDTIGVNREVLMIAEVPIGSQAPLEGRPLAEIELGGEVRVLGLGRRGEKWIDWEAPADSTLQVNHQPVVVATKAGLSRLVLQTVGAGFEEVTEA